MRPKLYALALTLFSASAAAQAAPDELKTPAERQADPPPEVAEQQGKPAPPESLRNRPPLIDTEYRRKKLGNYFTGLPIANSDPNTGFGFGARVYYFRNGDRSDPRFAYTPYQHRVFLQAFFSTKGLQFHWLDYDAPAFDSSAYRLRASAIFGRNTQQHYFGRGARSMEPLRVTGFNQTFDAFSDYNSQIQRVGLDGQTRAFYNKYDILRPQGAVSIERSLAGGLVRTMVGLGASYTRITDYTGTSIDAVDAAGGDVKAPMARTWLREDCDAGRLVGCNGGFENTVRAAVVYDSRDFEPDPNSGVMAEVSGEFGTRALGSDFDFARVVGALRGYYSPAPRLADVVLAGRLVYQVQTPGTPFFSMNVLPFSEDFRLGLGGSRTMRGYAQDRFVGPVMALANLELRWTIGHLQTLGQDFGLILVPFVDIGGAFDRVADTSLSKLKRSQGGAARIAWNQATIITVEYGVSSEDSGLYINFNHIF